MIVVPNNPRLILSCGPHCLCVLSMLCCRIAVLNMIPLVQLSTTEGNSYYVGTKMDAFVYDTLNAWYQEDMGTVSLPALF